MYQPKFTITNKILKYIASIEACREIIDHAPLLPYYEKQFQEEALKRTVHYGTHIEGNELNFTQTEKVLEGKDVVARERDIQEVLNYRQVIEYIEEFRIENSEFRIDKKLIQRLHKLTVDKILEKEKVGEYRKTQVVIKNSFTGHVSFTPPPAAAVEVQINDFIAFINVNKDEEIHPILKAGVVHYEFVRIHPFTDGNGRVARALSTLILFMEGYDIRRFFSLEEYFDRDAERYYEALKSVTKNNGDVTEWLTYFTEGLAVELAKIKDKVEKISIDGKLREKLGGKPIMLTDRQLKIIEYIQEAGYLQNKAFDSLFPFVSEDTVLNEIKGLLSGGIIKKTGSTKGAKYVMS